MSNNNHLSSQKTQFEGFQQANSDSHLSDNETFNLFREKDLFLKSQASLADTTCDENSPISQRFQDPLSEEHSFSLTEFNLDESHSVIGQEGVCSVYLQKGFCLRGVECTKMHNGIEEEKEQISKNSSLLLVLFEDLPELLITCRRQRLFKLK